MSVHAYHPQTGASVVVTEDTLAHMRISGWMLVSEWEEQQAARAQAEAASQAKTPDKTAATGEKAK